MMSNPPITQPRNDRQVQTDGRADPLNLVEVVSKSPHTQLQGDGGEFAITAFNGHGPLWADNRSWEIDPLNRKDLDEQRAGATFCAAWVVARRFLDAPASSALAYAHSAAAATVIPE